MRTYISAKAFFVGIISPIVLSWEFRMLDLTGIMFSSVMMLMVIVRAVQLDRSQPWFQRVKRKPSAAAAARTPWKRQE